MTREQGLDIDQCKTICSQMEDLTNLSDNDLQHLTFIMQYFRYLWSYKEVSKIDGSIDQRRHSGRRAPVRPEAVNHREWKTPRGQRNEQNLRTANVDSESS